MVAVLAAFVAGVALLQQLSQLPGAQALATACAGALALLATGASLRRRSRVAAQLAVATAAVLLGAVYAAWMAQGRLSEQLAFEDEGRDVDVIGVVATLPIRMERGLRFGFDIEQVLTPERHLPAHVALSWYRDEADPQPAQRWRFAVRLRRPHGTFNPGGFDSELWMLEQDLRAVGYVRDAATAPALLDAVVWRPGYLVERLRDGLRARLQQALGPRRYAGVLIALAMGDQGLIAQDDWTLFNRTGISHLVSISGLHITMIAALIALAAGATWRRFAALVAACPVQVVRATAGMLGALLYCLLAGWGVPAQRTFVMLATVALALAARARLTASSVLAAAAAVVCLWDPWAVTAPGFWLSFGAVACIFYSQAGRIGAPAHAPSKDLPAGHEPARPGWGRALAAKARTMARALVGTVAEASRVQAAITIGLVPLTLLLFSQFSPISPLANAVAIPLVSYVVTPLALLGAAACAVSGPLWDVGAALLGASEAVFAWLAALLGWMVQLPQAWIAVPAPPLWAIFLCAGGIAWMWAPAGWPLRWLGMACMVPALVWPLERPAPGGLWVTALDVGQGMALVIETATDTLVFDTGPRLADEVDAGSRVIVPYLRSRGIDRVALLVISHLDSDHSGGARSLLQAVRVDRVLTSIPGDHPLLRGAHGVQRCERGQLIELGNLQLAVFSPPAQLYEAPKATTNARSCVVQLRVGRHRVLLTGDVPARQEALMVSEYAGRLASELMVAPHHGSRTSSSESLVRAVAPTWVSVQAGYRSRFGHPHPQVLARYRDQGVQVVRSDWSGAARWRFEADGSVRLERWRQDHGRYWLNRPDRWHAPADADPGAEGNGDPALATTP
jgi:competence protein ComEC